MVKKLIIDTNWWISFIVSKKSFGLPSFFFGDFFFLFSAELIIEIRNTLQYPHIAKRINQKNLQTFLFFEQHIARIVSVSSAVDICRDKKDNFLLSLAKDGEADYLITEDGDLLDIQKFEKTVILQLYQFIELIKSPL